MITVPQAFFSSPNIEVVLRSGNNAFLKKVARSRNADNERYLAVNACTVVHSGKLMLQVPGSAVTMIHPGQMVFIPSGLYMITDIIPDQVPFQASVFFFESQLVAELFTQSTRHNYDSARFEVLPFSSALEAFCDTLVQNYGQQDSTIAEWKIREFLYLALRETKSVGLQNLLQAMVERRKESIGQFMARNCNKPLRIEDYAALTGRSISTFHRDFKRHFGVGPKAWLTDKRMDYAGERLRLSSVSVGQLAAEIGYENISHFIKAFRKKHGLSPKQYQLQDRQSAKI